MLKRSEGNRDGAAQLIGDHPNDTLPLCKGLFTSSAAHSAVIDDKDILYAGDGSRHCSSSIFIS